MAIGAGQMCEDQGLGERQGRASKQAEGNHHHKHGGKVVRPENGDKA